MKALITRQELADLVGLHRKTLWKDVKEAGLDIPERKRLNPENVSEIGHFYGLDLKEELKELLKNKRK